MTDLGLSTEYLQFFLTLLSKSSTLPLFFSEIYNKSPLRKEGT